MAATQRQCSPWLDLQPELLGLPIAFASAQFAVRAPALSAPLAHPPRWDGTFLSIPDGEVHRVPLPEGARRCHGSMGNWLFLEHIDGGCSLMNPFSKAAVVQLPGATTSGLPEVGATLVVAGWIRHQIHFSLSGSAFRVPKPKHFVDVAFFGGKLYALSQVELFVVEIDPSYNGTLKSHA
ncbi:hypothetical protein HU200_015487 [Digitaria exilis]|uniref:KIB1-4 beta-propeller domain-containing protein n=1 Tax=Digitaria exilis TaxID=1010633 RepID=A0A835FB13_9POAL|nr:hypothetical protein HU200_015487 [Digitaria exilis]